LIACAINSVSAVASINWPARLLGPKRNIIHSPFRGERPNRRHSHRPRRS
jgi:hypothetical protein